MSLQEFAELLLTGVVATLVNVWLITMLLITMKWLLRTVYYRSRKGRLNPLAKRMEAWCELYFLDLPLQSIMYVGVTCGRVLISGSIGILEWLSIDSSFLKSRAVVNN